METVKVKVLKPLFKNGVEVPADTVMDMEINTAFRFAKLGDIEILDKIEVSTHEVETAHKIEVPTEGVIV